jgi:hypothetical protein
MIGAIRVSGRWIDKQNLEKLSQRSQGPDCPQRWQLIEDFCRSVNWLDAKGRPGVASAAVALGRLEAQGMVQLPPKVPHQRKTGRPRGLMDDGQPLPPLPRLPSGGLARGQLRLRLIADGKDPAHLLWSRLIVREHPLGRAPLVGAQLRYLVECDAGIVAAFGFGPPAYHLECRDSWIGWDGRVRSQNLGQVIGLSRFLIRRGLRVPNLASQCYSLVLKRVAADWQGRYGTKPLLVETFVDRERHDGRSLAAANWRRIGQSKGRGRDDPKRQHVKSIKDVWLYELRPKARALLQSAKPEPVAPRSIFAPPLTEDWISQEMAAVALGDKRLKVRAQQILQERWARPSNSFYTSFSSAGQFNKAYQFIENPRPQISLSGLLAGHHEQTLRRMAAEKVVLLAQDTTGLSYGGLEETTGLGQLTDPTSRGLFLHSLQAFRLDGIPLGTAFTEVWARPAQSDTAKRNQQSCDEKESGRWVRALQQASRCAQQMPQTQVLVCADREADIYELYDQKEAAPKNVHLLVRLQHDRLLSEGLRLSQRLSQVPVGGLLSVKVPRRTAQPERIATLELRWQELEVKAPGAGLKKTWPGLKLYVVWARERTAPPGAKSINWMLLTTWPVRSSKMAARMVRWYALRWNIECWHKVLKEVCRVEHRQMKSAQVLERVMAFDIIIACRVLLLARLGRELPQVPAQLVYTAEELEALAFKKRSHQPPAAL